MKMRRIGSASLYLGDSREIAPTLSFDSVVCDPPYGMDFQSNHRADKWSKIENDGTAELLQWACSLAPRHSSYIFCRWDNLTDVPKPKSLITWVKNNWSMGDLEHSHARQTETILFYPGSEHFFPNGRPKDVIFARRTGNRHHPTEKPIELMKAIMGWTAGVVCDPFMGGGASACAALISGRPYIGIELDEAHFDIACTRAASVNKIVAKRGVAA